MVEEPENALLHIFADVLEHHWHGRQEPVEPQFFFFKNGADKVFGIRCK